MRDRINLSPVEEYCVNRYKAVFKEEFEKQKKGTFDVKRRFAQKKAIRSASLDSFKEFPEIEPALIWKTVYMAHMSNVSGILDKRLIDEIVSAENSWKKSSGHAFEEIVKELANVAFEGDTKLVMLLQKDLSNLLKLGKVLNEVRDISWLKEQTKSSAFDLYIAIKDAEVEDGVKIFGCIQIKTSIRDRVSRDREPSTNAMKAFFWSCAIVLDGEFLTRKFRDMVNGGSEGYQENGWHAMYVLSSIEENDDRICPIAVDFAKFKEDALAASKQWMDQRQWMNTQWRPKE